MTPRWPEVLWIVRHGQSAGNVARDVADAEGLARIALTHRDVDIPPARAARYRVAPPRRQARDDRRARGSGDVLAGIAAGLSARGADPLVAAISAVWLHGEAGKRCAEQIGPIGFLARELLAHVPDLLRTGE